MTTKEQDFELLAILSKGQRQVEQFRAARSSAERLAAARAIRQIAEQYRQRSEQVLAADQATATEHATIAADSTDDEDATEAESGASAPAPTAEDVRRLVGRKLGRQPPRRPR